MSFETIIPSETDSPLFIFYILKIWLIFRVDEVEGPKKPSSNKPQLLSLMEHTRLKNMAICKRKLPQNLSIQDLVKAINALDVNTLNMDTIELLQRMVPLDDEIKKYRDFTTSGKNIEELSEDWR